MNEETIFMNYGACISLYFFPRSTQGSPHICCVIRAPHTDPNCYKVHTCEMTHLLS